MWTEPFPQDERPSFVEDRSRFDEEASGVKHGSGDNHDILGVKIIDDICIEDIEEGLALRENSPLWDSGCSGGIHDDMGIFASDRSIAGWFMDRFSGNSPFIIDRPVRAGLANVEIIPIGDI